MIEKERTTRDSAKCLDYKTGTNKSNWSFLFLTKKDKRIFETNQTMTRSYFTLIFLQDIGSENTNIMA